MAENDEKTEIPGPVGGFGEVRLKPGFKNPGQSEKSRQADSSQQRSSNGPLSFDEMLEFTSRPSQGGTEQAPPPVMEPSLAKPPPSPERSAPANHPAPPAGMPPPPVASALTFDAPPSGLEDFGPPSFRDFSPNPAPPNPLQRLSDESRNPPWTKIGGMFLLGLVIVLIALFAIRSFINGPIKVLVKSKPSGAEVTLGEEHLGETPLELELANLEEKPVLKLDGYKDQPIPDFKESESGKISKVYVVLEKVPFPVDWEGLPKGTRVWLDGEETQAKSTVAGEHTVKLKAPGQASFLWSLTIPWTKGETYPIGRAIARELERRPVLKLSLSGAAKAEVIVKDGPRFTTRVSLSKSPTALSLPTDGTYLVKVEGTKAHAPFKTEVTLKEGSRKSVNIALWKPRSAAPARATNRASSRPYRPRPQPRRVYQGGGGSGAGQIAPPSF